MADTVLIFTFSPVQAFIAEARRASDLFAGSRILAELAGAAARAIEAAGGCLVYPHASEGSDQRDTPNKLVAVVPWDSAARLGRAAEEALQRRWREITAEARQEMRRRKLPDPDDAWEQIWQRQTAPDYLWQCFWAAADGSGRTYSDAYCEASRMLDAAKHSRCFVQAEEHGEKDSLSGRREALHRAGERSRDYWRLAGKAAGVTGSLIRPEGRERLDAIGATKRFWPGAQSSPSTSSVAAAPFLAAGREKAPGELAAYRDAVEALGLHTTSRDDYWPYDGDLFYEETLTPQRLEASYGIDVKDADLTAARAALRRLHGSVGFSPAAYYAVIVFDGDSMGEHIDKLLVGSEAQAHHSRFSAQLSAFSGRADAISKEHAAHIVYNGGDDVLALAPVATAIDFAHALSKAFTGDTSCTASAGIAMAHHLSPLDATLKAAREAEGKAKQVAGKAALCVSVLRRGGEETTARGQWRTSVEPLMEVVAAMRGGPLSSRFAYDVAGVAYSIDKPGEMLRAELKRLLERRSEGTLGDSLADTLDTWATDLAGKDVEQQVRRGGEEKACKEAEAQSGPEQLARWLLIARFLAEHGGGCDAVVRRTA